MGQKERALSQVLRACCSQSEKKLLMLLRIPLGKCLCANGPHFSIGNHITLMLSEQAAAY